MRIVYYLNQFYAQIGGETEAGHPLEVQEGALGPGAALEAAVADCGCKVAATIICGDNYFAEHNDEVSAQIEGILKKLQPDLVVAGPAFNAGRYGLACGSVMKIAQQALEIPAISGMYEENPGVMLYRLFGYIVPTAVNARGMREAISAMAALVKKFSSGCPIGSPEEDGYFKRGARKNIWRDKIGAERAVDMMLDKVNGRPFETEMPMPKYDRVVPSDAIKDLKNATIAVMTSGGIVPTGNPDHMESLSCTKYRAYELADFGGEELKGIDVAHGGYDPTFAIGNGNRVYPVDAMLELEREGVIGKVYPHYYVTVGNCMPVDRAAAFGQAIAKEIKGKVDGVILTST